MNSRESACKIQLVASRRVEGKPRTEVLVHLGEYPTPEAALGAWPAEVGHLRAIGAKIRPTSCKPSWRSYAS